MWVPGCQSAVAFCLAGAPWMTFAMKLQLGLLGGLYVGISGVGEVALPRKNRLLLATLALAGPEGLGRSAVVQLLWGAFAQEQAQASLRQALSAARRALGSLANAVAGDGERLWIDQSTAGIDVEVFSSLLASTNPGDREKALALYKGDLLAGIPLKEDALEEWLRPLRERLRARAIDTLVQLVEQPSDHEASQRLLDQLLALDPLNEAAHRKLISFYAAQGRTSEAVKQFTVCKELLRRELGVPPSHETLRLFEALHSTTPPETIEPVPQSSNTAEPKSSPFWRHRPTVAVLQFDGLDDEPARTYLARALTSDTASALCRHRWLSVSSGTALIDAGTLATITGGRSTISAADYVVTGDVRGNSGGLRITVRLADGRSGETVWSDSYDTATMSTLEVPEEVVHRISAWIEPQIGVRERQRVLWHKPATLGTWDHYHVGVGSFYRFSAHANAEALACFETCMKLEPAFAEANAWWAFATIISMVYYDAEPARAKLDEALAVAQRATELDDMSAFCHFALARVHLARKDYDRAFWSLETAIDLNPNMATAYCAMGDSLAYQGRLNDAVEQFAKAIHLSPRDPMRWAYSGYCGMAHLFKGDFEAAIHWSDDATRFARCLYWPYAHKAAALGHLGRIEEASRAVAELVTRRADFSLAFARRKLFFLQRDEQIALYLAGLAKAGVPES